MFFAFCFSVSLRGDRAARRGGRAHISRTLQLPQHIEVTVLDCDEHGVESIGGGGMDVDIPALQRPSGPVKEGIGPDG